MKRFLVRFRRLPRRHRIRWDDSPGRIRDWQGWNAVFCLILVLAAIAVLFVSCRG